MMRTATIKRETKETKIELTLNLDGTGVAEINTGVGFMDHMLTLFASHGRFDLTVNCQGDTYVDGHHSIEDVGICLGQAFDEATGDKKGITRYGDFLLPMDETLVMTACDMSGRDYLSWQVELPTSTVGDFDTELAKEFWLAFVRNAKVTAHIRQLEGENTHHILEAVFKCMGRSMKQVVAIDRSNPNAIPSTKGML